MEKHKLTKEYAKELAVSFFKTTDSYIDIKYEAGFVLGYMEAVYRTGVLELLESLIEMTNEFGALKAHQEEIITKATNAIKNTTSDGI